MRRKQLLRQFSTLTRSDRPIAWRSTLISDEKLHPERFHLLCCRLQRLYPDPFSGGEEGEEEGGGEVTSTVFPLALISLKTGPRII